MTTTSEVLCDACGADLTYTGNSEDYRIVVGSESKLPWYLKDGRSGGAVTDLAIQDPVPKALHFCGWSCVDRYRQSLVMAASSASE